jgi:hypothetical protein
VTVVAPPFQTELTLKLKKPVTVGPETTTELRLSEPTMKQLREAAKAGGDLESLATLIVENAKVLPAVVDGMGQRDVEAAARFFGQFSHLETPGADSRG